ncbi:MAG TPA: lipoyl(octanoyl) transferase LipB [Methylophilaceae bacterium]
MPQRLTIRRLGRTDYEPVWHAMQAFTASRHPDSADEMWVTEHPPVYTLGLNRRGVQLPVRNDIPLVLVDRGGKITYHGPGQTVIYLLLDLSRKGVKVRQLVSAMENAIITLLAGHGIEANARADAPGVYVAGRKIASLGLRLRKNLCYHGLALNVAMDLSPFDAIDPCGYQGMQVTQLADLGIDLSPSAAADALLLNLCRDLAYTDIQQTDELPV